ncbi:hypothetical protein HDU76_003062 [Blyttiomyces sp. JEL0837]|nr:hypothetical protein HDU76_003062 [Blyttiomyces sp. JEL0837]
MGDDDIKPKPPDVFCSACIHNQNLVLRLLSAYDPEDEEYFNESIEPYKARLEARYPYPCERCSPRVEKAIEKSVRELRAWIFNSRLNSSRLAVFGESPPTQTPFGKLDPLCNNGPGRHDVKPDSLDKMKFDWLATPIIFITTSTLLVSLCCHFVGSFAPEILDRLACYGRQNQYELTVSLTSWLAQSLLILVEKAICTVLNRLLLACGLTGMFVLMNPLRDNPMKLSRERFCSFKRLGLNQSRYLGVIGVFSSFYVKPRVAIKIQKSPGKRTTHFSPAKRDSSSTTHGQDLDILSLGDALADSSVAEDDFKMQAFRRRKALRRTLAVLLLIFLGLAATIQTFVTLPWIVSFAFAFLGILINDHERPPPMDTGTLDGNGHGKTYRRD